MTMMGYYKKLLREDEPMQLELQTKAVSKERPRQGRSGHMYTPERTRSFEKMIKDVAKTLNRSPYTCPVKVRILVFDPVPKSYKGNKRAAAVLGLINPPVGDLDNKVKAITDGLNGIAYVDDKQINSIDAQRAFGDGHFIFVQIARNGLSVKELERYGELRNSKGRD